MSLRFGTAGVRAPLGDGPDRMNARTVTHVVTAIARHLRERHPAGATVVVAGDARPGSAEFVAVACAVLADHGLRVLTPGVPVPTPVLAAAVRSRGAAAGLQVTASHNPPADNGIKLYGADGAQIVPPTDAEVEGLLTTVVAADPSPPAVDPARPHEPTGVDEDPRMVDDYVAALVAALPEASGAPRVALTAVHGVGGDVALRVLAGLGIDDVVVVDSQQRPDPAFPTVSFPNPERPEAVERVLALAESSGADLVLALDPDADRCAMGVRGPEGRARMLDGDAAGVLLADHLLARDPWSAGDADAPVVASTIVSSRLPSLLVPARGGRHVETLTGFKWLVRAGEPLRYAYEEAIGHCVLPGVVRDKDGISAVATWCAAFSSGAEALARLDSLHTEFGTHVRRNASVPLTRGADPVAALASAADSLAALGAVTPLPGTPGFRVDVDGGRAVVRPSGTEPLLKSYCEAWTAPGAGPECAADAADARARLDALASALRAAVVG